MSSLKAVDGSHPTASPHPTASQCAEIVVFVNHEELGPVLRKKLARLLLYHSTAWRFRGGVPTTLRPYRQFSGTYFSRVAKPWEAGLIALLFALLVAAMVLAWRDHWKWSYALFTVTILLSIYWFDYHATSTLTIQL